MGLVTYLPSLALLSILRPAACVRVGIRHPMISFCITIKDSMKANSTKVVFRAACCVEEAKDLFQGPFYDLMEHTISFWSFSPLSQLQDQFSPSEKGISLTLIHGKVLTTHEKPWDYLRRSLEQSGVSEAENTFQRETRQRFSSNRWQKSVSHTDAVLPPRDDLANLWLFSDNRKTMDGSGKEIKPSYMSFSFSNVTHDVQFWKATSTCSYPQFCWVLRRELGVKCDVSFIIKQAVFLHLH